MKTFTIIEVVELTGLDQGSLVEFVSREWVDPTHDEIWDEEDLARIRLIQELRADLGANDEAIPVILRLLDQLCCLRNQVRNLNRS